MIIIAFESTSYAMLADKAFEEKHFNKMVVPTPRSISHSCGISLQIEEKDVEEARKFIQEQNLKIKGIYYVDKENAKKIE